ncbi:hypothetical protein [Haloquadratum walsbyi]|uniref:hypothetical protein n=1 Tax=Haloquadratum walsbyi TaxID=293091 RepID=UPI00064FB3E9
MFECGENYYEEGKIEDSTRVGDTRVRRVTSAVTSGTGTATSVEYRSTTETSTRSPDYVWRAARSRRDLATAVNIADRHDPWGESLPLKPAGDDISRDRSTCDGATTHRETSGVPAVIGELIRGQCSDADP